MQVLARWTSPSKTTHNYKTKKNLFLQVSVKAFFPLVHQILPVLVVVWFSKEMLHAKLFFVLEMQKDLTHSKRTSNRY